MGKQILICSTIIGTIEAFLIPHIELLRDMDYEVDIAANCDGYLGNHDLDMLIRNRYDLPFQRTPFSKKNLKAGKILKKIVAKNKYDIVHFHTPIASAFGRFYIKSLRKDGTKIFYTAHGFHFYKGAPAKNWIIYYPMEKYLSRFTDVLITINEEDYQRASKKLHQKKIYKIPGVGIDIRKFTDVNIDINAKRKELCIPEDAFLLISVGELNKNKNHRIIIEAMAKINDKKIYYIICGEGAERPSLVELARSLNLSDNVILLGSRTDIPGLLKVADLFVFPSKREGLPVSVMEAMASGLPVIASDIRGCRDLIGADNGSLIEKGVSGWSESIMQYCSLSSKDNLKKTKNDIDKISINEVLEKMGKIYGQQ